MTEAFLVLWTQHWDFWGVWETGTSSFVFISFSGLAGN